MALRATFKETKFGVGDEIRVHLKVKEGEKTRNQFFEGIVIGIKGEDVRKTFTVRKIAEGRIGVEMIFPLNTPSMEDIEVVRHGTEGVRHAKLYYIRNKSAREIEKIFSRAKNKNLKEVAKKKKVVVKKAVEKKETKKVVKKVASKKTASKKEK